MSTERSDIFTWKGQAVTLVGNPVNVGDKAPDATLTDAELSDVKLSQWAGKIRVLNVVASLDTGICDTQTKKFSDTAIRWSDDVVLLTISMDLPFAQKRWCGSTGAERVIALSDFNHKDFGAQYGLLIKEKGLLARSVFVIDKEDTVKHVDLTGDLVNEPSYDAAIETIRGLTS